MKAGVFYAYFPHEDIVDWEQCFRRAKQAGAQWFEVSSMRLVRQDRDLRKRIVEISKELDLPFSFCTSLPIDGDVASDDLQQRRRGIEFIKRNIEVAGEMGGGILGGMLHGSTNKHTFTDNATRQKRIENSIKAVDEMALEARNCGVRLGLEICNRYENTMLNTISQGLEFLSLLDQKDVGLHLDTYHMNIEEDDLAAAIISAKEKVLHVHACENNRKLPGMGHINWREIIMALAAIDYTGALVTECFAIPFNTWTNSMCLWRDYVKKGIDQDLIESMDFLKNIISKLV